MCLQVYHLQFVKTSVVHALCNFLSGSIYIGFNHTNISLFFSWVILITSNFFGCDIPPAFHWAIPKLFGWWLLLLVRLSTGQVVGCFYWSSWWLLLLVRLLVVSTGQVFGCIYWSDCWLLLLVRLLVTSTSPQPEIRNGDIFTSGVIYSWNHMSL